VETHRSATSVAHSVSEIVAIATVTILAFLMSIFVDLLLDVSNEDSGWPFFSVVD
jgi:hypothetical protein